MPSFTSFPIPTLTTTQWGLPISVKDPAYGAVGDGVHDDTVAIQNWLSAIAVGGIGYVPAGTYLFTAPLSKALSNFAIVGDGPDQSVFIYGGANTTNDLFTIGDGVSQYAGLHLEGFQVQSNTTMTAGVGVHLKQIVRSIIRDVWADHQDGTGRFWHGIRFNGVDFVSWHGGQARAQQDGVQINGIASGPQADLLMSDFKISGCTVGLRCGGGFGGLSIGAGDIINNGTNVSIDTTLTSTSNLQVFFENAVIDTPSGGGTCVVINQSLSAPTPPVVLFNGTWIAGAASTGHGINIANFNGGHVVINGGTIINNADGIRVSDASTIVTVSGVELRNNSGWGIDPTVANCPIFVGPCTFLSNTSGSINVANITATTAYALGGFWQAQRFLANDRFALDANAYFTIQSGNPLIAMNPNDFLVYDRTNNLFQFFISGTNYVTIGAYGLKTGASTVSGLPTAAAGNGGAHYFVTDATVAASGNFGAIVAGGGANLVPVYSDGTNWRIG